MHVCRRLIKAVSCTSGNRIIVVQRNRKLFSRAVVLSVFSGCQTCLYDHIFIPRQKSIRRINGEQLLYQPLSGLGAKPREFLVSWRP